MPRAIVIKTVVGVAVLGVLSLLISLSPGTAHADQAPARAVQSPGRVAQSPGRVAQSPGRAAAAPAPTVIIGIPGLMWSDLGEHRTPTLWRLTGQGGAGGLSVRATRPGTCPMDGWLTLSAGQRARLANGNCGLPSAPVLPGQPPSASGGVTPPEGGAAAPGWQMIKNDNAHTSYHAQVGLLGDAVHKAGMCTTAVGPGAVFGLADGSGKVDHYAASPDKATAADWTRCGLTAVEIDGVFRTFVSAGVNAKGNQVPVPRKKRLAAATAADGQVAKVLAGLPPNAVVLVAGISDVKPQAHLRVAIANGAPYKPGYLTSSATRQNGLVTLTDLTATALELLNLPQPEQAVGSPWDDKASGASTAAKVETLREQDVAAQAVRRVQGSFFLVLGGTQLVLFGIAALALRRRWNGRDTRLRILNGTRCVALFWGAIPCATFLAGLVPWWQVPHPIPVLIVTVLGFGALVASISLAGPWRGSVTTPGLVIAAITASVLAVDVMTGSNLQINTLLGYTAIVAGRFYGFGNQAFALFAVAAILTAAWLAEYPLRQGRKGLAIALVAVIGLAAVAIDGLPAWGADFGGVLALVPTFAMLGLMVSGRRVSLVKVGLFGLAGVVLVLAISYWNAQSAHPTHLGRFWQDLENGDAWGTVTRKFSSMIGSLGFWPFTVPLAGAIIFLYFVLMRPTRWRASLLDRAYAHSDTTRPALVCSLTVGIIGTLVNDSGVVILAVAFSLAIPLVLAATVRALELDAPAGGTPGSARPEPRSAPTG